MADSRGCCFVLGIVVYNRLEKICCRLMDYEGFEIVLQFFLSGAYVLRGMRIKSSANMPDGLVFQTNVIRFSD